jgi:cytoskeletal protein RodZ
MSQENENEATAAVQTEPPKELVGDTIRKERITRRITVETIAKDLKLNVKYIKALESNEYAGLPADPYVRVYLKSLAKYLSLDSEAILKKFYEERGMSGEKSPKEPSAKITISVKQKEESHAPMFILAIVLIAALALFSFIAKKKGWLVTPPSSTPPAALVSADKEFAATETSSDAALADSLVPAIPPQPLDSTELLALAQPSGATSTPAAPLDTTKPMSMKLSVLADSVWVQVYCDGVSWKNVVTKHQSRDFTARDSFNVHVGNIAGVKFACNGRPVNLTSKGVTAFKIDKSGRAAKWTLIKWNAVFAGRL